MAIGHDNVCDYSVGDKVTLMIYLNHCGTGCDASCCTEYGRINYFNLCRIVKYKSAE